MPVLPTASPTLGAATPFVPLAVSEGFVVAAVVVSAVTIGLYLVITAARTAKVSRRLDELEADLAGRRPDQPAPEGPAAPGSRPTPAQAGGATPVTGKPVAGRVDGAGEAPR